MDADILPAMVAMLERISLFSNVWDESVWVVTNLVTKAEPLIPRVVGVPGSLQILSDALGSGREDLATVAADGLSKILVAGSQYPRSDERSFLPQIRATGAAEHCHRILEGQDVDNLESHFPQKLIKTIQRLVDEYFDSEGRFVKSALKG